MIETPDPFAGGRFIPLAGSRNARHMGGYRAADQRVTRADRLFRSGWFDLSTEAGRQQFDALAITQLVDFRTEDERGRQPLPIDTGKVEIVSAPIANGAMGTYLRTVAALRPEEIDCLSAMTRMYREMLDRGAEAFATMLSALSRGSGGAMLICSTGKDRTGVGAALLLSALGIGRDDVFADYAISADVYRGHETEFARRHGYERHGHSLDLFQDVFTVHPQYLAASWERAVAIAGSMDAFVTRAAGGPDEIEKLRSRFTRTG